MQLDESKSQTFEHVLFERMGVSIEDAFSTGADFIDEKVGQAARQGVDVEPRIGSLLEILLKVTEPKTMAALSTVSYTHLRAHEDRG